MSGLWTSSANPRQKMPRKSWYTCLFAHIAVRTATVFNFRKHDNSGSLLGEIAWN